ncbi:hypothetical protein ACYOEI_25645 [Singulisphaera rosea]
MKRSTGQILRRLGLLTEAVCLLGIVSSAKGKLGPFRVGGNDADQILMVGVAVGFLFWVAGTLAIYWPRKRPASEEPLDP